MSRSHIVSGLYMMTIFHPPLLRLKSRKPLWRNPETIDITSRWRDNWQSASVVNSSLVEDPTIWLPSFYLHRRQRSLLNRFRTSQGRYKKWGFTDKELCDCGETQTMSHIVNSCPSTKFNGGLLRLHETDEAAVNWLTTWLLCRQQQRSCSSKVESDYTRAREVCSRSTIASLVGSHARSNKWGTRGTWTSGFRDKKP